MDHALDLVAGASQLHRDRVDKERHVVGQHVDDGVRRAPTVPLERGVVDAELDRARRVALIEAPVGERGSVEVEVLALDQILRWNPAVVLAHEPLGLLIVQALANPRAHLRDQLGLGLGRPDCHLRRPPLTLLKAERIPWRPTFAEAARGGRSAYIRALARSLLSLARALRQEPLRQAQAAAALPGGAAAAPHHRRSARASCRRPRGPAASIEARSRPWRPRTRARR